MEGGSIVSSHAMVHAYDTAAASLSYDPELVASEQASAYLPVTSSRQRACNFPYYDSQETQRNQERSKFAQLDSIRSWFNDELDKLEKRRDKGLFTQDQLDSEVALLIKERDLKLNWLSSKNDGGRGCYRANKRRRGTNDNHIVSTTEGLPEEVSRPACTQDVIPVAYSMITQGACLPSMVTWWIPPLRSRHDVSGPFDLLLSDHCPALDAVRFHAQVPETEKRR